MITCPNCGTQNKNEEKICVKCGAPLSDFTLAQTTRALGDTDYEEGQPRWGAARFDGTMNLVFDVLETGQTFSFNAQTIEELQIGRRDPDTGDSPPIDLETSDGLRKGVSRIHAMVVKRDGALHIVDNNSANGSYLNGQRLIAHQPRILRDGDDLRLGHLVLRISFRPR